MKIKGNKILFSLFLLLSVSVMAMIFYFSAQWADSSEQESVSLYDLFLRYTHLDLVSLSDEVHQIFVPGRACRIFDVFVDSCGASFGILIFLLITLLIIKIKDKRRMLL